MQSKSENAASASGSALTNAAILLTLTLVTMLYAMTVTIANVSLPQIKGALSATTDEIALIITFNIIATAVATPAVAAPPMAAPATALPAVSFSKS